MTGQVRRAAVAAAITAGCMACALVPPRQPAPARPHPQPGAGRTCPAAVPASGLARLLPQSPARLQAAAALAARFAATYDTHRPGEPAGAWLARLAPMATRQLTGTLARAATNPAAGPPAGSGQAIAERARDLTPASVIFTVQVRAVTAAADRPARTDAFAVTVTAQGSGWAVYDIEPASAGDAGGTSDAAARQ